MLFVDYLVFTNNYLIMILQLCLVNCCVSQRQKCPKWIGRQKQKIVDGDVGGDREEKKPEDDEVGIELRSFVFKLVLMLVTVFCCLQTFESEEQGVDYQNKTVTTENVKPLDGGGGGEQEKSTVKSDECQVRI